MKPRATLPAGTRLEILQQLIKQELSSQGLAWILGVSGAAVRQHLATLEALGLVTRRKVITRPSRPTYLYRLSPEGLRAFPKRYDLLLGDVIEALVERLGAGAVGDVVCAAARRFATPFRARFERADASARWNLLVGLLEEELAWQANIVNGPAGWRRIVIHHCPFHDVSRAHPVVCGAFFTTLIQELYSDVPVEHIPAVAGPACCSLVVAPPALSGS